MSFMYNHLQHTPTFTFTDKGLFPVGSVVTIRKDLIGFDSQVYNNHIGEQYVVEKYDQYGAMYLLNLDGTPCEWLLGGSISAKRFEPVLDWKELTVEAMKLLTRGDVIMIACELNRVVVQGICGFCTTEKFLDTCGWFVDYYACGEGRYNDTAIPVYKQVPKMVDLTQFKQTTSGDTNMTTKQFTKSDLKTGHRVSIRDWGVYVVLLNTATAQRISDSGNVLIGLTDKEWIDLKNYDEEFLTHPAGSEYDIMKVEYSTSHTSCLGSTTNKVVVWERPAEKTQSQIEMEKLGEQIKALQDQYNALESSLDREWGAIFED